MEKKPSLATLSIGYGVIIALAIVVYSLILFLLNLSDNTALSYVAYLILLVGILLSQINYRNKYLGGYISYGDSFLLGMLTGLFVALIYGVFTYIFLKYIDPSAMEKGMEIAEQKMLDKGMTQMEIEQAMEIARKFQSAWFPSLISIFVTYFIGLLCSLFTSIFIKKENINFGQPIS